VEELEKINLERKRRKITKKELASLSGYTYHQIRRMFSGNITLKELTHIKSILGL